MQANNIPSKAKQKQSAFLWEIEFKGIFGYATVRHGYIESQRTLQWCSIIL